MRDGILIRYGTKNILQKKKSTQGLCPGKPPKQSARSVPGSREPSAASRLEQALLDGAIERGGDR